MDGRSYYFSRNGGYMSRAINPNMSERVKTETEFLNTRLNAAEFGCAGSTASAIVRGITSRWRFIRTPKMVGDLTKIIQEYVRQDTTYEWGRRQLPASKFADVQDRFNMLFKKPLDKRFESFFKTNSYFIAEDMTFVLSTDLYTTIDQEQELISAGANGIMIQCAVLKVLPSQHTPFGYRYVPASDEYVEIPELTRYVSIDGTEPHRLMHTISLDLTLSPENTQTTISGIVFLLFPYKEVNNTKQIIQSQCQALWVAIPEYFDQE